MTKNTLKPEILGTRAGYIIRFTCSSCARENIIITRTARDHFKETHIATCKTCRNRSTIRTPSANHTRTYSPQYLSAV